MVKKLINKLKSKVKTARKFGSVLGLSALLLVNSSLLNNCKSVTGPEPYTAVASLSVSPESGIAPLEVKIMLNGTPSNKIISYSLKINSSGSYLSSNSTSSLSSRNINQFPHHNTIERTRRRNNINKESKNLKIRKPIRTKKDQNTRIKGIEEFARENSITNSKIEEQTEKNELIYNNFQSRIPGSFRRFPRGLEGNIQSYRRITAPQDINEEIKSARPINITRVYDNLTKENFTIFVTGNVTDEEGRKSPQVSKNIIINPKVKDVYFSGTLKDNETDFAVPGMLKVFDSNRKLLETDKSNKQGYILTDSSGRFNFHVEGIPTGLEEMIIKAAHGTPGNPQGWVRTKHIPVADDSNLDIVAVSYGEFSSNPNEFRNFMYEVTHDTGDPRMFDYRGFNKGFIIIKENLDDSLDNAKPEGKGKFTNEQVNYIKNIITPGVEKVEKILGTSNYSIKTQATSENYNPGAGVIYLIPSIAPGGNPNYGGLFVPRGIENLQQGADIYLRDNLNPSEWALRRVTLHEIGHTIYGPTTNPNSIMAAPGTYSYSSLDLKGTNIVYEPTYLRGDWKNGLPVENLKYILGRSFNDWN